ncbi:DedA family protein [Brevibacillus dissolubilis]|uniref:DedA family protein n=1 Tax=Brevibacillus dissolubilis TaxID=1844116 RepID=UPI001116A10A|nr:DedA family protein [Brevibacillus dissolubilis]
MEEIISQFGEYITTYGYGALYGLFFFGILGLPVPEESLLVFSGYLVSIGHLSYWPTLLTCFLGSISAMTAAYWIGRSLGHPFIEKYGKRFGLGYDAYKRTEEWFNRVGKWALPIGYFIPVVRQYTAYFAGITKLPFGDFALYAYLGGAFWSTLFVTLGWQLGERWEELFDAISRNLAIFFILVFAGIMIVSYVIRRNKTKPKSGGTDQ